MTGAFLISCSRAQARGGRPLLLIGSQGCQSGPFSSLIGLLKKKKRGCSFPPALARAGFGGSVPQFLGREVLVARGDGKVAGLGDVLHSAPNADSSEFHDHRGCSQRERGRVPLTNRRVSQGCQTWWFPKNTEHFSYPYYL